MVEHRRPGDVVRELPHVRIARIASVDIENLTTGELARATRLRPDGQFDSFVRLEPGDNRIRVTAFGQSGGTRLIERTVRFDFGYSDEISVFLNGRLLFSGNDRYSFNFPRRQGLITIDQGSLYLPLLEGENDLVLAVTDVFGGWGLMGRFEPVAGLEIE